jgi:hypothetical protein
MKEKGVSGWVREIDKMDEKQTNHAK